MLPITPTKCWRRLVKSKFLALLLFAIGLSACQQSASSAPFKRYTDPNEVPKISVADAKKEVDAGTAVIVDSRGEGVYKMEHIAGSINIPNGSPKEKFADLPKGMKAIIYCSCNGEGTSIGLAYQMNQAGIPETAAMVEGFQGWKSAGYPMERAQ